MLYWRASYGKGITFSNFKIQLLIIIE